MKQKDLLTELQEAIHGLPYYSESEFPFVLSGWGKLDLPTAILKLQEASAEKIVHQLNGISAFFTRIDTQLSLSQREEAVALASRYKNLHQVIIDHSRSAELYRSGTVEVTISLLLIGNDEQAYLLETKSIET
jgi:hypothetical protein